VTTGPTLAIGALSSVAMGTWATAVTVASGRRARGRLRLTFAALAGGMLSAVAGIVVTATRVRAHGGLDDDGQLVWFAAGLTVSGLLMLVALLRLPGIAALPGAAARHAIEGVLVACSLLYIVWALVIEPHRIRYLGTPLTSTGKAVGLFALMPSIVVLAVAATVVWRTRRRLAGAGVVALSVIVAVVAGSALLILMGEVGVAGRTVVAVVWGAGFLATAYATRRAAGFEAPDPAGPARYGTQLAWMPVSAAIVACGVRLGLYHAQDNVSVVLAMMIGLSLSGRQILAMRDVRAYADRVVERENRFRDLAFTDPLTSLGNRRAFTHALERWVAAGSTSTMLSIDLDGFKNVNDMRGHDIGDAVLVEVGRRLRLDLRSGDVAARLGGDEFAVLLASGPDEAIGAARRLRAVLAVPYEVGGEPVLMSASVGFVEFAGGADLAELMRHADLALRFAKQQGKNRVEGYDAAYATWLRRRTTIELALRGATERGELSLVYQPVVTLPDAVIVGGEALLRWHHPELGTVPPGEFIPIAEESGQIGLIGRFVLKEACRQLSRWLADGYDVWVSVNISVRELHHPSYVARVVDTMRAHGVPPGRVVLEVTEHAVALDMDELVSRLATLRDTGVRIALDDFGAGYSSLGQLRQVPVDILKIDRSIVAEPSPAPLVDVVARLGERLGLAVIAEGVALPADRAVAEAAGCGLAQGDLFGRPMPAERFETMLLAAEPALPVPHPRVPPPAVN
jgi:diguanylate cyclase (GGDEF)-like protein